MHKFTKVYIDLDGVIADFERRYIELFGTSPASDDARKRFGTRFGQFIQSEHFATLDLMEDAHVLLDYLSVITVPVEILSSTARPITHSGIAVQKQKWLEFHGIKFNPIFVPGKRLKAQYATPTAILIDDTESNITDWNDAGGCGILHKTALTTIAKLDTMLTS